MSGIITGTEGHEVINGTDGDDTIIGLAGYDTLDGGEGSDTYIVNPSDFNTRFVDFYNDSGTSGTDIILASEDRVEIGIGSGFGPESGIETIDGIENSIIVGDGEGQIWNFSETELTGISGIFGNGGNDEITGTSGVDNIDGGSGSDILFGASGADTLFGGLDSDYLYGGNGHDTLNGGEGNDTIEGGNGRDTISGGEGHDTIDGGNARDVIFGGEGHDVISGGNGSDRLTGGAGFDILDGGENGDIYFVGLENAGFVDTYQDSGTFGTDRILATEDGTVIGLINGFGPDNGIEIIGSRGNQDVTIGGTNDSEIWDFSQTRTNGIQWINALDGNDIVTGNEQSNRIDAGSGHDIVNGGAGNDRIIGNDGNDILNGGEGRDRLDGGSGFDTLDGGESNDTYLYSTASNGYTDIIQDTGTSTRDRIIATEDNVEIGLQSDFSIANGIEIITARRHVNVTLQGSDEGVNWDFSNINLHGISEINGGEAIDIIQGSNRADTINGGAGNDQLYGGRHRDTLNGGEGSDFLYGENGRDTLSGGSGNDILNGGQGQDILTGGEGFDIFEYASNSGHDVITDFTIGEDLIDLRNYEEALSYNDLSFVQTDSGLSVLIGTSSTVLENVFTDALSADAFIFTEIETPIDEDIILNAGNESAILEGGTGNDTLNGSHGDDTLIGSDGDDHLNGGNADDTLIAGNGNDILIGSHGNDTLFGDDGDDTLDGGNNDDALNGGAGNDILIGFNGADILIGGAGDDNLDGGNDNDVLEGGAGHDVLDGFNGRDTLDGGEGNDILIGYNDADILIGGTGHDILTGGFGADQFVFSPDDGHDIITDFETHSDMIDFTSFNGEITFEDLLISSTETGVIINFEGSSVLIEGIELDALAVDMFIF